MQQPLLSIEQLCIQFPDQQGNKLVVNGVCLQLMAGKIVAIVGESGSGKSVTALSLLQLLPATAQISGSCLLHGQNGSIDLLQVSKQELYSIRGNRISMIFQEPMTSLNPLMTCGDQIAESIELHLGLNKKESRKKAIDWLQEVEIPFPEQAAQKYPHQLSGGQRQRVMIAMAMCTQPEVLIADEPTTALDVTVQQQVLLLIKKLQQRNRMGVIFITHDWGVVATIADEVVVMHKGEVVENGPVQRILHHAAHPYTIALMQCRPALYQPSQRLPMVEDGQINISGLPRLLPADLKKETPFDKSAAPAVLQINNLVVQYQSASSWLGKKVPTMQPAVNGVSFEIGQGSIMGLVGESGCGKTTIGRAILKMIPIQSGQIVLNNRDITHLTESQMRLHRKEIQLVFQDPYGALNPRMSVGAAILEAMQQYGLHGRPAQQKEAVMDLLRKVQLQPEHYNRYPHQFSGGQRQRICIARALAVEPSLIVFDESVSALDVSVQAQVLNLINDLKAALGFSALFISHDLSVVKYISDQILVMQKGMIVEAGNSQQIYIRPQHPYTQTLIKAIPTW